MSSKWEQFGSQQEEPGHNSQESGDAQDVNRKTYVGSDGVEHVIEYKNRVLFIDGKEKSPFLEHKNGKTFMNGVEQHPFIEHRDGKTFTEGVEQHPFIEHKDGKNFMEGKEVKPFSDIDTWAGMNMDKSPEEMANSFIEEEERQYKKLGHEEDFYICKTEDGGLRLQLVKPIDPNIEWHPGNDPRSKQLLVEHYRKMKEQQGTMPPKEGIHKGTTRRKWTRWFT